jgi:hypothetical protein
MKYPKSHFSDKYFFLLVNKCIKRGKAEFYNRNLLMSDPNRGPIESSIYEMQWALVTVKICCY